MQRLLQGLPLCGGIGVMQVEDVLGFFTEGGDFGVFDVDAVGEQDTADGGQQAVAVLAGEFQDAAFRTARGEADAGFDGEVTQLCGLQAFF